MTVIPAINETSFSEVEKKIGTAKEFGSKWVHLDVADGKFTTNTLWNDPEELKATSDKRQVNIEIHLMVENSDEVVSAWLKAGVKRVIVHVETAKNVLAMKRQCAKAGAEFVLAANPDTPLKRLLEYPSVEGFLVLAVMPGLSGQKFREDQLEKVAALRQALPNAKIEVDGGVGIENAPKIKKAGADILVAASAIWGSDDPEKTYKKLHAV